MIILLHFLILFAINSHVKSYGKSRIMWHDSVSCGSTPPDRKEVDKKKVRSEPAKGYNCGVLGIGVVQKIPYNESHDRIPVDFSSACVRCGLCIAIADKINKTLMAPSNGLSCDRYFDSAEAEGRYKLREIRGKRFIGDDVPGSVVVKSTGEGLWTQKLKDKCEEIISSIDEEYLLKYLRARCNVRDGDLRDILCQGRMGASRDCRGIFVP
ncbi:uncharacterized protein LOC135162418 isoform X2 [Diachasmimorpha longicaudata]|uniref:uncharacterized protein LOC135162418 isoform X2 n=1 Tax=Diachasmimorpha longicaudata TaxID=58733 RepID=UPI0030B8BD52